MEAAEKDIVIAVRLDEKTFKRFARFDMLTRRKQWVRPALFSLILTMQMPDMETLLQAEDLMVYWPMVGKIQGLSLAFSLLIFAASDGLRLSGEVADAFFTVNIRYTQEQTLEMSVATAAPVTSMPLGSITNMNSGSSTMFSIPPPERPMLAFAE